MRNLRRPTYIGFLYRFLERTTRSLRVIGCIGLLMGATLAGAQPAKDVKGSRDHPMISRFEGASITWFDQKEFDEYRIATGPVPGYRPDGTSWGTAGSLNDANSVRLEGRVWKFRYS